MKKINNCPTCNGTGEKTIVMTTLKGKESTSKEITITCIDCDGKPISDEEAQAIKEQKEWEEKQWCKCGHKIGVTYVADGVSKICSKHHYICNDCKKIVQIG